MKKSDLVNGDIVQLRNGQLYYVIDDKLANDKGHTSFANIGEDLRQRHTRFRDYDIVKAYKQDSNHKYYMGTLSLISFEEDGTGEWTWEREEE